MRPRVDQLYCAIVVLRVGENISHLADMVDQDVSDVRRRMQILVDEGRVWWIRRGPGRPGGYGVSIYNRPEVTPEDQLRYLAQAQQVRHKSTADIVRIVVALMIENARLTAEVNDHRQARGYEMLETHRV